MYSDEIEAPPAKAWWCLGVFLRMCSCEIEAPPAKAWWCLVCFFECVAMKLKHHRLQPGGVFLQICLSASSGMER